MTGKENLKQRVIFLDLDKVLFDTQRFKEELAKIFYEHGGVDFYGTCQRNRLGNYSFRRHLAVIKGRDKRNKARQEVELLLADSYKFLFPDAKDFLSRFRQDNLILLTRGDREFQQKKIFNLGINVFDVFSQVIVAETSKADMAAFVLPASLKESGSVFFVDDMPHEIYDFKKHYDFIFCIMVDRSGLFHRGIDCSADLIAKNLVDVGDFIENCKVVD